MTDHCLNVLTAGLSGTSFTGYPLPDVAAGINLKNQVTDFVFLSILKNLQGQIFKKDLFGKESAAGRNLRKRMSGTAEVGTQQVYAPTIVPLSCLFFAFSEPVKSLLKRNKKELEEKKRIWCYKQGNPESNPVHLPFWDIFWEICLGIFFSTLCLHVLDIFLTLFSDTLQENSELLTEAFENPESTPVHLPRQADDKSSIIRKSN